MISRDGAHTSLWQETTFDYRSQNVPADKKYDVVIVGGGITGVSTALELQRAGKKCLLLEAHNLCYGTTGGTTAHINTLMDTPYTTIIKNFDLERARLIAQAASNAIDHIKLNIRKYSIDCGFKTCTAFLFAQDEKQEEELKKINKACKEAGLKSVYSETIPLPIEFVKAIVVSGQAKFHPLRYVYALAEAFETAGGVIVQQCRVTAVKEESGVIDIESEKGLYQCSQVIYATHIPPDINLLHLRCIPYRSYAMAIRLASGEYPKNLAYDMYDPYHYYRTQHIDDQDYLIAGGKDHKTGHEANTEACFRNLESHVRRYFDVASITNKWSSQYYEPADGIPYIGQLPGHSENVLVATGFGGNGMTYGTIAAGVLKSMVLKEENKLIDVFSPSRVKPVAAFKNFTEHNLDVLKQLVTKLFSSEGVNGFADIAPGEGKVIKVDGQPVGVHKDEFGSIHTVNATCTHMKCTVAWNLSEKSWDCPCHGARFSMDGEVLNGPASRDLEYINLELVDAHSS